MASEINFEMFVIVLVKNVELNILIVIFDIVYLLLRDLVGAFQKAQKCKSAGALPWTPLAELTALSKTP